MSVTAQFVDIPGPTPEFRQNNKKRRTNPFKLKKTKHRSPKTNPLRAPTNPFKTASNPILRPSNPLSSRVSSCPKQNLTWPICYTGPSWPHEQHPAQSGIITTAPQLRAGCWPDLISDSNERTPAATLAGFFLAPALFERHQQAAATE
jgi:hypothetical protein